MLEAASLEANRHGQLSRSQRIFVYIPRQPEMLDFPVTGWKEEGWLRASVNDLRFWLPPEAMSASGEISVYFVPRSRAVVNVESR